MRLLRAALSAAVVLLSLPALALPAGVAQGPSMGGITEYRLQNGLQVLLLPEKSQETMTVNVTYLVGSRHEGYGESGMAHLLEHMLFKGTPRFSNPKAELIKRGGRFNGTTYFDRTNYFVTFPATDENLAAILDLEADRMVNAHVAKRDLDSEMTVVRNEFESGENQPSTLLRERMLATAYTWHNYGRSVIGTRSDIENVPIERLQGFYKQYYQPDNAALVIAGRFDEARALELVATTFGRIAKPQRTLQRTYTVEPPQDGERSVVVRRVGDVQLVAALYHMPPGPHPDYAAVNLLTALLSAQPSGRLHKGLVETGKASSSFGTERQLREAGSAMFGASVRKDQSLDAARDTLLEVLEGFEKNPVTEAEVERARTQVGNQMRTLLDSSGQLAVVMSEFIGMGDWRLLFWYRDRLAKTTREDVQRAALAYLRPANRTLGLFYPAAQSDRVAIPDRPDVQAMLANFTGATVVEMGEAFDPTPANIEQRVLRRELPGGMKLAMLPKKTRGGKAVANLVIHWGDEASVANRAPACSLAGAMLARGTLKHTREELRDALDRLRATVNVSGHGATIEAERKNLAAAMKLAAEMLREPSFPPSELAQIKRALLTGLDAQRTDPGALAALSIARHLTPYPAEHWYYTPTLDEQRARLQAVTLDEVKACHAQFFGASHSELAVVGDFDPEEVTRLATALFSDWKTPAPYQRIARREFNVAPVNQSIETPDKANAVYRAGLNLRLKDSDPDYPALLLGNYLFGGSSDARLSRRIRETDGISYSVGSWLTASVYESVGEFGMRAILAPQNRVRLEAAVTAELRKVLENGYDEQELADGKRALLQAIRVARNSDATLASALASQLEHGRTYRWNEELERRIAELSPAQVREAMRRHLKPEALAVVKAGDFAKTVAGQPAQVTNQRAN